MCAVSTLTPFIVKKTANRLDRSVSILNDGNKNSYLKRFFPTSMKCQLIHLKGMN